MYEYKSQGGQRVEWNPEDEDAAKKAMAETDGTGVSAVDLPDQAAVDLSEIHDDGGRETSRKVRERYIEIVEGKE